jgi:hypothetical protein
LSKDHQAGRVYVGSGGAGTTGGIRGGAGGIDMAGSISIEVCLTIEAVATLGGVDEGRGGIGDS